ncbi:hypothetical protein M0R45_001354 [Rubus argutus]|uniref:Uncharacterized protein n=1 Tax=Rubus argutus TaxID=59490 RepID=A0AAW1VLY3_RUBAR
MAAAELLCAQAWLHGLQAESARPEECVRALGSAARHRSVTLAVDRWRQSTSTWSCGHHGGAESRVKHCGDGGCVLAHGGLMMGDCLRVGDGLVAAAVGIG